MITIKLGVLTFVAEKPFTDRDTMAVWCRNEHGSAPILMSFDEWQSLVNLATVIDAAHKSLQTNVEEIRRLDFALAHERHTVAKMKPVYEAALAWAGERRELAARDAEMNERLRRGETVTTWTGGTHPDHVLMVVIAAIEESEKNRG